MLVFSGAAVKLCGPCFRSPFLFPMLSPEEAVDAIISGILADESVVFVPRRLYYLMLLKRYEEIFAAYSSCLQVACYFYMWPQTVKYCLIREALF